MSVSLLVFFILVLVAVGGSLILLNAKNLNHMMTALVLIFLSIAGLYTLLSAGILAVVQVLVYTGGFSFFAKFVAMRITHDDLAKNSNGRGRYFFVTAAVLAFFVVMFFEISDLALSGGGTLYEQIAGKIETGFSIYLISLLLLLVLFLVAFIGSSSLVKRSLEKKELNADD